MSKKHTARVGPEGVGLGFVQLEGYLFKKKRSKHVISASKWTKRFFVVKDNMVGYYRNDKAKPKSFQPLGDVNDVVFELLPPRKEEATGALPHTGGPVRGPLASAARSVMQR